MNSTYELINTIISFCGFVALCVEIGLLIHDQKNHRKEVKIQESIQLSDKFKDLISNNLSFVLSVLERDEYSNVIAEIDENELKIFDTAEFDEVSLKHPKLKEYYDLKNYMFLKNFNNISTSYLAYFDVSRREYETIEYLSNINWKLTKSEEKIIKQKKNTKQKNETIEKLTNIIYYKQKIGQHYSNCCTDTLNELEELCMALNKGIVDEDTVYQSLHQIVIRSIKYFYPIICKVNKTNNTYDKYYTHTITLYNNWTKRRSREKEKQDNGRSVVHKSTY